MKLGIFVTHPVQYHVPIWRRLAREPGLDVRVYYFSDVSVRGGTDPEFGVGVSWDVDLLGGYSSVFLTREADISNPASVRIPDPHAVLARERFDWVFISGYTHGFERQVVQHKKPCGYRLLMRGEFSDERPGRNAGLKGRLQATARDLYLKWFYRHIDGFGVIGTAARRHLRRLGVPLACQFHSPYNVDTQLFELQRQHFNRQTCRQELNIAEDCFVVLFSGKFIPRKAPLHLAAAVSEMAQRQHVALVMLGDGELRGEVERRFRSILGGRLILPGFINQSQLGRYFAAADAFVLPSAYETWGLVVNEAMQFGLPVIASDRVGCRHDLIVPGRTGEVVAYGDVRGLAGKLDGLAGDVTQAQRLGLAARQWVRCFTVEHAAAGLLQAMGVRPASGGNGNGHHAELMTTGPQHHGPAPENS